MYSPEVMRKNTVVGTPDEVIARLKAYEALGYDEYSFWIDTGMSFERKKASLRALHRRRHAGLRADAPRSSTTSTAHFEDGEASFESLDPATGAPWADDARGASDDVDRAVAPPHRAFTAGAWPALTATARGKLLFRLADLVAANAASLAEIETRDTGKIIRETSAQIAYVADYYRYYAGLADKIEGAHLPIDKPDMEVWLRREPVGVVAAIVPWNSQLFLAAVKIGPALAPAAPWWSRPPRMAPAPLLEFARLVHEAGFPPGRRQRPHRLRRRLRRGADPPSGVAHIAFTGGPDTARAHRAQLGGEPRHHLARTRRQVALRRLRRRRPRQRRQRPGRRHLRRHRPELRRRLAPDRGAHRSRTRSSPG